MDIRNECTYDLLMGTCKNANKKKRKKTEKDKVDTMAQSHKFVGAGEPFFKHIFKYEKSIIIGRRPDHEAT
jgi:hypothetical protein